MRTYKLTIMTDANWNRMWHDKDYDTYTMTISAETEREAKREARKSIPKSHHIYVVKEV